MRKQDLKKIMQQVANKELKVDSAIQKLKFLPFEDLGFAKIDHHRELRNGFPEVVFCQGKTIGQIVKIFRSLEKKHSNLLLTRADKSVYKRLRQVNKKIEYNPLSKTIILEKTKLKKKDGILVICAGTADIPVAEEAAAAAEVMGNEVIKVYDVGVAGLHRLLANKGKIFNANCIIAVAGMEGALPSVVGGLASCPVIAVPTSVGYGANFNGVAPLLTMMNSCSPNVAVVNINNGFGAGYIASLINKINRRK